MDNPAHSEDTLEQLLTNMVENTTLIITNDLPSLLAHEEVANYRRVHKDQILKNIPKTAQAINQNYISKDRVIKAIGEDYPKHIHNIKAYQQRLRKELNL